MTLRGLLEILIRKEINKVQNYSLQGLIVSVDETTRMCVVQVDDTKYSNVLLQAAMTYDKGLVLIPVVDSVVTITFKSKETAFVSQFTEVSKIICDTDLFQFNGGENDGMVLLHGILTKINRLEDKLKSHEHSYIPYPGGSPAAPILTTVATALGDTTLSFDNTVQKDLENTKILQ